MSWPIQFAALLLFFAVLGLAAERRPGRRRPLAPRPVPPRMNNPNQPGIVSDPTSKRYGSPCNRHERDPFSPGRCWKCGAPMRPPAMSGGRAHPTKSH